MTASRNDVKAESCPTVGDSASGRRADVQSAVKALGGKVEAFYYAFGADDVLIILDLPDNLAA